MLENMVTVFTPTFNRGYILPRLYKSLVEQTLGSFIWMIIDDGSTDNTKKLVDEWINEGNIEIMYYKQSNAGKSVAHNRGVEMTKTVLFTCVDSDDYLRKDAIEEIIRVWNNSIKYSNIIGILTYKGSTENSSMSIPMNQNIKFTTLRDGYQKYGLKGDTFLVYKTSVLSKYSFPVFKNEKFVPEAYLYDLMDQNGKLLVLNKILYYCEYLEDGYTNNMTKLLFNNPKGYIAYIKQRLSFDDTLKDKILDSIRYIAICIASKEKIDFNIINPLIITTCYPIGYMLYLKKFKNI